MKGVTTRYCPLCSSAVRQRTGIENSSSNLDQRLIQHMKGYPPPKNSSGNPQIIFHPTSPVLPAPRMEDAQIQNPKVAEPPYDGVVTRGISPVCGDALAVRVCFFGRFEQPPALNYGACGAW